MACAIIDPGPAASVEWTVSRCLEICAKLSKSGQQKRAAPWESALNSCGSTRCGISSVKVLLAAGLVSGLRGLIAHVCEQLYFNATVLLATLGRCVRRYFLILADPDEIEAVRGNTVL
jgi:hypothetical protein